MPRLVVHIGDPKTGTSSIQRALQIGAVKPRSSTIAPWRTHNAKLVGECLTKRGARFKESRLQEVKNWLERSPADIAVISSEFFAGVAPSTLDSALREFVPVHAADAMVVAYVRPHASRYLSAFIQRAKTGAFLGNFEDFFQAIRKNDPLVYADRFAAWRETFGDRFALRAFMRSEMKGGDAVADFFSTILGDEPFSIADAVEENVSVSLRSLSGLRVMHRRLAKTKIPKRTRAVIGAAMSNYFLAEFPKKRAKPQLDRGTADILKDTYREDACRLDELFFDRPIFETALRDCSKDALDAPFDISAKAHFAPEERKTIVALSDDIGGLFKPNRAAWLIHYRNMRGHAAPSAKQKEQIDAAGSQLEEIDSKLRSLASILA